jgi:DNA-binding GntR family transcriptional regulator
MARRRNSASQNNLSIQEQLKRSTSDIIFDALRELILTGELIPGTALIEKNLAEEFGVSKTPIREALHHLSHIGLVDMETAKGATVHTLTSDEIKDIWDMRQHLEPLALELSIPHLTDEEIKELGHILNEAKIAIADGDAKQLSQLNTEFHEMLYSKADNHLLVQWLNSLSDRRRLVSMHIWELENHSQDEWQEHRAILDAVEARDIPTASQALKDHISNFNKQVLAHIKNDDK